MSLQAREAALGLYRLLGDDGSLLVSPRVALPAERVTELYRHMRRARRLDERMILLQRQGRIGFYGACTGQEAPPIAAALALSEKDWVFPALRESVMLLVRGLPLDVYLAQLFGNSLDILKGRQMPSHPASRRFRQVSWSSVIATQLPHAVGAAMAARRLGRPEVMLAFLGDGATSHPDFHAALNFAGVFRAPVVFVCQNNHYAISVPAARQTAAASFAIKALAYGIQPDRVDGNDVLAVFDALSVAIEGARSGGGSSLVECVTYRMGPHSSSDDPSRYREDGEVEAFRDKDPILKLCRHLAASGHWDPALDTHIDEEMDAEISRSLARVEHAPPPALESLFEDVYERLSWPLAEQQAECRAAGPSAPRAP